MTSRVRAAANLISRSRRSRADDYPHRVQRRLFLEPLEARRLLAAVATDKPVYAPAETAIITASSFKYGETVKFQVLHNDGTPNTGSGHDPWTVKDGGAADLDHTRNGKIKTTWYVHPDDSAWSSFTLTAVGLASGRKASTTFLDDGGDFALDFVAAEPHSYDHSTGGGSYDDRTKNVDVRESLEGHEYSCDDIITFFTRIAVDDDAVGSQSIEIDYQFDSDSSGQSGVGYYQFVGASINYNPVPPGDGPGGTDAGMVDDGGSTVTGVSVTDPTNPFHDPHTDLLATIGVDDLEAGESVILRIDVRLGCDPGSSPTGNVDARIMDARVVSPEQDKINVGAQTVPLHNPAGVLQASTSGRKYHDLNADGDDEGVTDPPLGGWTIAAFEDEDNSNTLTSGDSLVTSAVTDATTGTYTLALTPGVTYIIVEQISDQTGWLESPDDGTVSVNTFDTNYGQYGYVVTLESGEKAIGNDFANYQNADKSGVKFHDLDGDGVKDAGEPGLADWTITLTGTAGDGTAVSDSVQTADGTTDDLNGDGNIDPIGFYWFEVTPGTFTISETLKSGWSQSYPDVLADVGDNDSGATDGDWDVVLTSGQNDTDNDFGNFQQATKSGVKFNDLNKDGIRDVNEPRLPGWEIQVYADDGDGVLEQDEFDDGPVATDTTDASGDYSFTLNPGSYIVVEVLQPTWFQSVPGGTDELAPNLDTDPIVLGQDGYAITLTSGQVDDDNDFGNFKPEGGIIVIGPDKSPKAPAPVLVVDKFTGDILASFLAYEANFKGGTRVATGDLTGDGIDEIITAPGRGRAPEVRVFTQTGQELEDFRTLAYAANFKGGVHVAVGDVDGDDWNDIITAPSSGKAEIKVFRNLLGADISDTPLLSFIANFGTNYVGGAFVGAADMGSFDNGNWVNELDGKAEIVVGSGPGTQASIKVFDVSTLTAIEVESINPFSNGAIYKNGVNFDIANLNDDGVIGDPADDIPDLVVGSENGGGSRVETWIWDTSTANLERTGGFVAFNGNSGKKAPVRVAAVDDDGDRIADEIATVQGPGGKTGEIRFFDIVSADPLQVTLKFAYDGFPGPYWIAALNNLPPPSAMSAEGEGPEDLFASDKKSEEEFQSDVDALFAALDGSGA